MPQYWAIAGFGYDAQSELVLDSGITLEKKSGILGQNVE